MKRLTYILVLVIAYAAYQQFLVPRVPDANPSPAVVQSAPRVSSLKAGDTVRFYGVYEPNSQGGVIHWTHHDPQGRHVAGWLEHNGRRYQ